MTKRSKQYREAAEKVDRNNLYTANEAIALLKGLPKRGFDETVEAVYRLNVDPRKADQLVRGTVNLPHGTGKTARVVVFARGPQATAALEAGADEVGDDELIAKVAAGYTDFDAVVATPDMMGKVGRLGRVLGPRGLMPNPKTGTVTMDVTKAVADIKGGKIEFRVDKHGNLSFLIGKLSFEESALDENFKAVADEVKRLKPSTVKGRYITKATITSTMGPGVPLDPSILG
ncbi:50S ribosomal protein L1 [Bifidobacterium psychraerophilum]|jgi:large subunit ribosomal protein L1|uniref:Large ribosomal subunit protein uL1 n=1 Tax=Bifidobacterium psychraerophilum TaxID=218140 RepID=A0A087CFN4_9BIFI|nr:50S ribosomal protein L1 [Bifidobacterium psychraerophilum]KFI82084.1 Ribosomal protein L1 [Bifidobacterium psychraerophilum]MCI1659974.1 50S ribosomal protein L1 [Bifidobacterium psychraerophilum]MCI1804953.1 50S ribosomal protein L1 [Bifidobacterium psychraerophilum]MCI2176015.1 50S ribosomal protein L1 [Bifidobacterium psychraerophilum]MCI2182960.1 50S ribosomal protein L1 [Bifidobacterium psychraerophilum]